MSETYPPSISSSSSSSGDEAEWLDVAAHKDGNDDDNKEEEEEEEQVKIVSLIDDKIFSDVGAMLDYVRGEGDGKGLDFLGVRDRLGLEFYGMVRLVNFGECFSSFLLFY